MNLVKLYRAIDKYMGGLLCLVLSIFSWQPKEMGIKNILVVRLWTIGESILTLPMIHALRKRFPKAKISVLVTKRSREIFTGNKDIDKIIHFGLKNLGLFKKFDLAIDTEPYFKLSALLAFYLAKKRIGFSHGIRSLLYSGKVKFNDKQHAVLTFLDLSKMVGAWYKPDKLIKLAVSEKDKGAVEAYLKNSGIKKGDFLVGICPGAAESAKHRMWPAERFSQLADKLIKRYKAKIIFVEKDKKIIRKIQNLMKYGSFDSEGLSLKQVIYLIENCKFFISNDTGPMHIAASQGVKTIGLFGPNLPLRYGPFGKGNKALYHKVWCSPCVNTHEGSFPECFNKEFQKCLKLITVDEVLRAVRK